MPTRIAVALVASALSIGLAGPAEAQAATSFEGTVVAKSKAKRTFSVQQDEGGGTFKFKVNEATRYQRVTGFGDIKVGARKIEVTARKNAKGRWIALIVERSGKAGGGGGGGGGGGADDGPNHT